MVVFKYEWKQNKKYILSWSIVMAIVIFIMIPVYYEMISTANYSVNIGEGGFLKTLGLTLNLFTKPLGMYSYLTGFLMLAGGIFSMNLGLNANVKECVGNTSEFLLTKTYSRRDIYSAKFFSMFLGVGVLGIFYMISSFISMTLFRNEFSVYKFFLLSLSFFLVSFFFGLFGILIGIYFPKNRSTILTSSLSVLSFYGITAFARTVNIKSMSFLSPFSFFNPNAIDNGFYEVDYLIWYFILLFIFYFLSRRKFIKSDIVFM